MLSITSDYRDESRGCPEPCLRKIADAGFSHIQWGHNWNTDYFYSKSEIEHISKWLKEYGLILNDIHASDGVEKCWTSPLEHNRLVGVELVQNRIEMAAILACEVVVLHELYQHDHAAGGEIRWDLAARSLDAILPFAKERGVRIAFENVSFDSVERLLAEYSPDQVGLCYDSGHGNMSGDGLDRLEKTKARLIAMHLHDNNGNSDEHKLPFSGTLNWEWLARIIANSPYEKPMTLETHPQYSGIEDEKTFLAKAFEVGTRFSRMVDDSRAKER